MHQLLGRQAANLLCACPHPHKCCTSSQNHHHTHAQCIEHEQHFELIIPRRRKKSFVGEGWEDALASGQTANHLHARPHLRCPPPLFHFCPHIFPRSCPRSPSRLCSCSRYRPCSHSHPHPHLKYSPHSAQSASATVATFISIPSVTVNFMHH